MLSRVCFVLLVCLSARTWAEGNRCCDFRSSDETKNDHMSYVDAIDYICSTNDDARKKIVVKLVQVFGDDQIKVFAATHLKKLYDKLLTDAATHTKVCAILNEDKGAILRRLPLLSILL